jgi:hypothetical protein
MTETIQSGDNVFLHDTQLQADLHKAHESNGTYYATHDQPGGPQAHKLRLVTGSAAPIVAGAEIFIQSLESGDLLDSYLRPGGSENDLYYEAGDNPGPAHTWVTQAYRAVPDGEPIRYGDRVILLSQDPGNANRSMGCNAGDGYVSVTNPGAELRQWKIIPDLA